MIDEAKKYERKNQNSIVIQINNSCSKSTIEMLKILSKFKNENILVKTILSYGDLVYKSEIIKTGYILFGDKFSYIENFMPYSEYAKYLSNNDILILN